MVGKIASLGLSLIDKLMEFFNILFSPMREIANEVGITLPDNAFFDGTVAQFIVVGTLSFFIVITLVKWIGDLVT